MAEEARTLLRSAVRAFYNADCIIMFDAIMLHSCLRDTDLAYLMNINTKLLRKMILPLKESGLIHCETLMETKVDAKRPTAVEYFYIDVHRAIDVVKYRVKRVQQEVEKKYGQSVEEKKEYACPLCKAAYTQMEVLDDVTPDGFRCKRCQSVLSPIEGDSQAAVGHEVQSRLNQQLAPFEKMLAEIDSLTVPEVTFQIASERSLPVQRDDRTNPGATNTMGARSAAPVTAGTVRGMKVEEGKLEVDLQDEEEKEAERKAEADRKAKLATQNALPSWHTASTIGLGAGTASIGAVKSEPLNGANAEDEKKDVKKLAAGTETSADDQRAIDDIFKNMESEDEDEDDEDDDDDDSDDEDDSDARGSPEKKVRIAEPATANGNGKHDSDDDSGEDTN